MNSRFLHLACLGCSAMATIPLHAAAVLEEVIVTAQKRSESVQDVPIAISVIGGDKLDQADIGNLQELTLYVPNYYQARSVVSAEVYIRGVGSSSNPGFEQSVGMFADGIYWGRSLQTLTPLFDLARIEVLKGPQSILFGKNTIAGAVSMHSRQPTDTLEGRITGLTGTDGQRKLEAIISGPLTTTVSARLAVLGRSSDGYIDNSYDNSTGPASDSAWLTHIDTTTSSLHLDYQWDDHILTSITGYTAYRHRQHNDIDMTPTSLIGVISGQEFEQYSQELRIVSPGGERFDYIAGLYFQHAKIDVGPNQIGFQLSNIGLPPLADGIRGTAFEQTTDTASAFFQGSWQFADTLALKAGLRYTYENKEVLRAVKVYDLTGRQLLPGVDDLALNLFWRDKQNTVPYEFEDERSENQLSRCWYWSGLC